LATSLDEAVERAPPPPRDEDYGTQPTQEETMDTHVEYDPKKEVANKRAHNVMPPADDMSALGELICRLNPYTKRSKDPTAGLKATGGMQLQPRHPGALAKAAQPQTVDEIIADMPVEVVRNYGEKWAFKGQTFAVKTAVRIPYRFEVTTESGETYWQMETLLIGYAGGEGPG